MSKPIMRFLSLLLVLQLIIPYSTFAAEVGEFTSVVGNVTQTRAKEVITPVVKSPIELKDLIVTARTSSATMVFPDDSTITLSENTKLEIKEFLFKDKSRTGIFSLAIGKLTADVKKYIGGDNVFEVHSPTVGVGVRGTGFEFVEGMKDGNVASNVENQRMATVTCTDGSLNLSAFSTTGAVISTAVLEAGQVAVIIGGIITISMIGAAAAAAIAKTTETGAADATGGAGTGTGGTDATGGAAAATGLSTAAIAGIAIGGAAVVGGVAAAAGGGGGGGSGGGSGGSSGGGGSSSGPTILGTSCSQFCSQWPTIYMPGASCSCSDANTANAYSPIRLSSKCPSNGWGVIAKGWTTGNWSFNYFAPGYSTTTCTWSGNDTSFTNCINTIVSQEAAYCTP